MSASDVAESTDDAWQDHPVSSDALGEDVEAVLATQHQSIARLLLEGTGKVHRHIKIR